MYARFEFQNIKVTNIALETDKSELQDFKIVFASDFQYDMSWDNKKIEMRTFQKAIDIMHAQEPDLILLGGDYVNYASQSEVVSEMLGQLEATYGVIGVLGNHDYGNLPRLVDNLQEQNIQILQNAAIQVGALEICGVEDYWKGTADITGCELSNSNASFSILLTHQPDYFETLTELQKEQFDLTLSGHLHAGQVTFFGLFPFPGITPTNYGTKYLYGMKEYNGHKIYITSGLGGPVFGKPLRFGAQPEIVALTFTNTSL